MSADELNERQREGVRMLATGMRPSDVATALNVTPQTVSTWKGQPAFAAALTELQRAADEAALQRARHLRDRISGVTVELVDQLEERLRAANCSECGAPADGRELAAIGSTLHRFYSTTSAQTGLTEAQRHEVQGTVVSPEDEAKTAQRVLERLRAREDL